MADLQSQINQARQSGYSDDEITQHLAGTDQGLGSKISQASGAGYSSKEILDHLGSTSQPGQGALPPAPKPVPAGLTGPPAAPQPQPAWYDKPLVHNLEDYIDPATGKDANSIWGAIKNTARGMVRGGEALSSPKNLAITGGMVALNAIPVVGEIADVAAAGMGAANTYKAGKQAYSLYKSGDAEGAANSVGEALPGAALTAYSIGKSLPTAADAALRPTDAVREVMAPSANLDKPIAPGELTPRERYNAAQDIGVQLNKGDATGGRGIFGAIKRVNQNSLFGHGTYDDAAANNVAALNSAADDLINRASPKAMDQTEFGDAIKTALQKHKETEEAKANEMYGELQAANGDNPVPMGTVRDAAQAVADSKQDLIDNAARSATGGVKSAFGIAKELAQGPEAPPPSYSGVLDASGEPIPIAAKPVADTLPYRTLSDIRSNLLSKVRDGEIKDGPGAGMVKQLISTIDNAMTSSLSDADEAKFREANDIFKGVKETHENPSHFFHRIAVDQSGMGSANTVAGLKPEQMTALNNALSSIGREDLTGQAQRQMLQRILKPNTEDMKTKTLTRRLQNINQEQLGGVLSTDQIGELRSIGKIADAVGYDFNPSGTGKLNQQNAEMSNLVRIVPALAETFAAGRYGLFSPEAIAGALAGGGATLLQHPVARFMHDVPSTDFMMRPGYQFTNRSIWPSVRKAIAAGGASTGGAEPK